MSSRAGGQGRGCPGRAWGWVVGEGLWGVVRREGVWGGGTPHGAAGGSRLNDRNKEYQAAAGAQSPDAAMENPYERCPLRLPCPAGFVRVPPRGAAHEMGGDGMGGGEAASRARPPWIHTGGGAGRTGGVPQGAGRTQAFGTKLRPAVVRGTVPSPRGGA